MPKIALFRFRHQKLFSFDLQRQGARRTSSGATTARASIPTCAATDAGTAPTARTSSTAVCRARAASSPAGTATASSCRPSATAAPNAPTAPTRKTVVSILGFYVLIFYHRRLTFLRASYIILRELDMLLRKRDGVFQGCCDVVSENVQCRFVRPVFASVAFFCVVNGKSVF